MTAVLEAPEEFTTPAPEAPRADEALVPIPNRPLRETGPRDYLRAACWGIASALAAAAVSVLLLPVQVLPVVFLLGAGLGVLGYLDQVTHLILDRHTMAFATAAAVLLVATQVSQGGFILGGSLITAAAAFLIMAVLGMTTGLGGGDVKLAPVAAALLAAVSPLAALLWIQFTFTAGAAAAVTNRIARGKRPGWRWPPTWPSPSSRHWPATEFWLRFSASEAAGAR